MSATKRCEYCGAEYTRRSTEGVRSYEDPAAFARRKYCTPECSHAASSVRLRAKFRPLKRCQWCGVEFLFKRNGTIGKRGTGGASIGKYCSRPCSFAAKRARRIALEQQRAEHAARRAVERPIERAARIAARDARARDKRTHCRKCGDPIVEGVATGPKGRQRRECDRCYYPAHLRAPVVAKFPRRCVWCEREFLAKHPRTNFCRVRCFRRWDKAGFSLSTPAEIVRARRLYGLTLYMLQRPRSEWPDFVERG